MDSQVHVRTAIALLVASCALVGACAHTQAPGAAEATRGADVANAASVTQTAPTHGVVASTDLQRTCGINPTTPQTAPKFDLEQATLDDADKAVLQQVARCVTEGPLRGRTLHLTGRADPRGESEYNMALGSSRASSVGSYLEALGVARSQIVQSSRGKLDATGRDEASWRLDRRVDLE